MDWKPANNGVLDVVSTDFNLICPLEKERFRPSKGKIVVNTITRLHLIGVMGCIEDTQVRLDFTAAL